MKFTGQTKFLQAKICVFKLHNHNRRFFYRPIWPVYFEFYRPRTKSTGIWPVGSHFGHPWSQSCSEGWGGGSCILYEQLISWRRIAYGGFDNSLVFNGRELWNWGSHALSFVLLCFSPLGYVAPGATHLLNLIFEKILKSMTSLYDVIIVSAQFYYVQCICLDLSFYLMYWFP